LVLLPLRASLMIAARNQGEMQEHEDFGHDYG
jgi:hypothetical protein